MKNMNKILLCCIVVSNLFLYVDARKQRVTKQKRPDKQQIHLTNHADVAATVTLRWRADKGLHTEILQDLSVEKGKSIMVKAPLSGFSLVDLSVMSSNMVAEQVGVAVGSAVLAGFSLGAGAPEAAALDVAAETAVDTTSDVAADVAAELAARGVEVGGDMEVHENKAMAHGYTYFTFESVSIKNKKSNSIVIISSKQPVSVSK